MNKIVQLALPLMSLSSGAYVLAASANEHLFDAPEAERAQRNIFDTPLCFDIHDKNSTSEVHTVTPDMRKPIEFGAFIGAMAH